MLYARSIKQAPTRLDYCQYLLSTQINYTITNYADHVNNFSHDAINRYLQNDKMTARIIWEHVKGDIIQSPRGCIVFDDSVLDENYSHKIELVKLQYSGNAHGLINGIGMVNCLYVNPDSGQYWIVDYRIYDPDKDGKTKLDHVREMLIARNRLDPHAKCSHSSGGKQQSSFPRRRESSVFGYSWMHRKSGFPPSRE